MKRRFVFFEVAMLFCSVFAFFSCQSHYEVAKIVTGRVAIDKNVTPDPEMVEMVAPYRVSIDSMMNSFLGTSEIDMDRGRPECLLGNLVAEVLRLSAARVLDKPADMGLMNVGGMRKDLAKGDITVGDAYEILPFENSLCVLTMKGTALKQLFSNLAVRGGECISGARLVIDKKGNVLKSEIQGKAVEDEKLYAVATIDYLSEGNDGMKALQDFKAKECPDGLTLRSLFIDYVKEQTAQGKSITSSLDGRIIIK